MFLAALFIGATRINGKVDENERLYRRREGGARQELPGNR